MKTYKSTVCKVTMFLAFALAFTMVTDASAYYTYTYSGSPFTFIDPSSNPHNYQSIQGYFTVDNPLDPNQYYSPAPYTSFSFTANNGGDTYASTDPTVTILQFVVSTWNGILNGWDIELRKKTTGTLPPYGNYWYTDDLLSNPSQDFVIRYDVGINWNPPPPPPYGPESSASVTYVGYQGQWTGQAAVPEPSTMLLLGSGLIGLAGYGRKRFFKK